MPRSIDITTRLKSDDDTPAIVPLAHADCLCFSRRSPVKDTPNEDALAVISLTDDTTVLIVADGMGGLPKGGQASNIAINNLINALRQRGEISVRDTILTGIEYAQEEIKELQTGTTIIIAEIQGNMLRHYSVGDSLLLVAHNDGTLKYENFAQSPINYAVRCGALSPNQAMNNPQRNLISNYIGIENMTIIIGTPLELTPEDTLILSSDAIPDNLYNQEICQYITQTPLEKGITNMITACQKNMMTIQDDRTPHPDDLTVIGFKLK